MDPFAPTKAYAEHIGSRPLLDIGTRAAAAGAGTYALSKPILNTIVRVAGTSKNPVVKAAVDRFIGSDVNKARRRLAILAAGLGAASGLYSHGDFSKGYKGFMESLTQKDYWKRPENMPVDPDRPEEMLKIAAFDDPEGFFSPTIPTAYSATVMNRDPYLPPEHKTYTSSLLLKASEGRPKFSRNDLARTAIRSGVDFGAAFLLGQGVGRMLSMPPAVVNRLSVGGGIANAVIGSGIFNSKT